jgi:hypothetical protein
MRALQVTVSGLMFLCFICAKWKAKRLCISKVPYCLTWVPALPVPLIATTVGRSPIHSTHLREQRGGKLLGLRAVPVIRTRRQQSFESATVRV